MQDNNSPVNSVVEGLNGKNGHVVLLAIVILGFGYLLYSFMNKAFEFVEGHAQSIVTQLAKTEDSINNLSKVIVELNTKFIIAHRDH